MIPSCKYQPVIRSLVDLIDILTAVEAVDQSALGCHEGYGH